MTALLQRLGLGDDPVTRRRTRELLKRRGIDTSHWVKSPTWQYTDEQLAAAVAASTSYAGVLRELGIPVSGGSHSYLARRIRQAGFDTTHFRGKGHNRGSRAPRLTPDEVLVVLPPRASRPKAPLLRRAMVEAGVQERCVACGCDGTWQGHPLRLIVDHVNGNWFDNRLQNLRFLCPNCHAQTATWCRRKPVAGVGR